MQQTVFQIEDENIHHKSNIEPIQQNLNSQAELDTNNIVYQLQSEIAHLKSKIQNLEKELKEKEELLYSFSKTQTELDSYTTNEIESFAFDHFQREQ
jgi:predicted  nucleic acid-binding Zn-ribbon protein